MSEWVILPRAGCLAVTAVNNRKSLRDQRLTVECQELNLA